MVGIFSSMMPPPPGTDVHNRLVLDINEDNQLSTRKDQLGKW
jgi:hypothetical protein